MKRGFYRLPAIFVALVPLAAVGQLVVPTSSRADGAGEAGQEDKPPVVKLVLHPAAEPRAALKYRLLPPLLDLKPGNAALLYNKIGLRFPGSPEPNTKKDVTYKLSDWASMPLADLPREEIKRVLRKHRQALDDLDMAARRETCDWELPLRERDFISLLLPEVQQTRNFARLLAAAGRLQIAEGNLDEAIRTLQTGYSLGRHVAEGPTLINSLVGIAICQMMSNQLHELIQQPAAPNLYWALSWLPQPLVDMRPALETEMNIIYLSFPELREAKDANWGLESWQGFLARAADRFSHVAGGEPREGIRPMLTALAITGYPVAKRHLIQLGSSAEEVEAMPVPQVVAIYMTDTFEEIRDGIFKWLSLPYWQASQYMDREENRPNWKEIRQREIIPLASLLLPAVSAAHLAEARNVREIAMLQAIEAIRIYGASHEGRLPKRLADITEVPIPLDPITGKDFAYRLSGDTAVLESPAPPGKPLKQFGKRFEIKFAR